MRRIRTMRRQKEAQRSDRAPVPGGGSGGGALCGTCGGPPALLSKGDVEEPTTLTENTEQKQCPINSEMSVDLASERPRQTLPDATSCHPKPQMDADQRLDKAASLKGQCDEASATAPSINDRDPTSLNCPPTKQPTRGNACSDSSDSSDGSGTPPEDSEGCGPRGTCDGTLDGLVFVVAEAMLDVCAEVDQLFLTKYGLKTDDIIRARPEHENLLTDMQANWRCYTTPGGSSQNTARVLQWVLRARRAVSVFGCIGADKNGEHLASYMKKSGIHLRYAIDDKQSTGICCVCMVGSHRSIVTRIGAGGSLSLDHLRDPGTKRMMQRAQLFYVESYGLSYSSDVLQELADYATQHNIPLAINLSAQFICSQYVESLSLLIEHADIVFGNRCEARSFACASRLSADGIAEVTRMMCALPKKNGYRGRTVVITNGSQPTIVAEKGLVVRYAVPELSSTDQLIDTIGAGDAFAGGFLAGLLVGADTIRCVEMGHSCSRFVLGRRACDIPSDQPPPVTVEQDALMQLKRPINPSCT